MKQIITLSAIIASGLLTVNAKPGGEGRGGEEGRGNRERPSLEEVFTRLDADEDGAISYEEFRLPPRRGGKGGSSTDIASVKQERFNIIDTNGDGVLSQEEFLNAPRPKREGRRSEEGSL